MSEGSSIVAFLFVILVSFPESETANITALISKSLSPSYAVEGKNFTLEWNYTLGGRIGSAQFAIAYDDGSDVNIATSLKNGAVNVQAKFKARFRADITDTRAELTILAVQRSDEKKYKINILTIGGGSISETIVLVVNFSSSITNITGQIVREGGNATLKCSAEGKPKPTIIWTRLSDDHAVTMPLTSLSRNDSGAYRCTANNGVGIPAIREVALDVQYKPDLVSLNTSTNKVCAGMAVTFTCSGGPANPPIQNYTLYEISAGLKYISSCQVGVFEQILHTEGLYRYICNSSNSVGNTSSENRSVEVQVSGSVKISKRKVVVSEGANVTVHCNFSGFHSQHVSWINASNYKVETGSNLKFLNIRRHYDGEYDCSASNVCGVESKRVYIDVQYPVEATDKGQNYSVFKGRSVTFKCPVAGNPEPNITWFNGNNVPISFQKELESRESGCYTCIADNSLGKTINITQCLTISKGTRSTTTPSTTASPSTMHSRRRNIRARMRLEANYEKEYQDLKSVSSKRFVGEFVREMDKTYKNVSEYKRTEVTGLSPGSVIVYFILYFSIAVTSEMGLQILKAAISVNGTFGRYKAEGLDLLSAESAAFTTPRSPKITVSAGPSWAIIGAVAGGVVLLGMLVGVLVWWVHKQRKYSEDTRIHNSDLGRHDDEGGYSQVQGAYAQSGPPAANGTDGAAEQQIEGETAIPTYAVVYKAKKKRKKLQEEVPPVYAVVDKSKKKKKKINDNNLYETFDEAKKGKKPGELLYADLGDFQNPAMSTVSISPQPLPATKKPEAYERTDYAVITQFLKGNATVPQNDGNEDTEMKPICPSKKKIQGKDDNETPI